MKMGSADEPPTPIATLEYSPATHGRTSPAAITAGFQTAPRCIAFRGGPVGIECRDECEAAPGDANGSCVVRVHANPHFEVVRPATVGRPRWGRIEPNPWAP